MLAAETVAGKRLQADRSTKFATELPAMLFASITRLVYNQMTWSSVKSAARKGTENECH
jgi:hypothetical protein